MIILAGDIETNPGPRSKCGLCKKKLQGVGQSDRMRRLRKRYHAKWSDLSVDELIMIKNGSNDWYCTSCKADCGLYSRAVLNGHKAINAMLANLFISEDDYENVLTTRCKWICPKWDFFNFSDSFFDDQLNLMCQNRFDPLSKDSNLFRQKVQKRQTLATRRLVD